MSETAGTRSGADAEAGGYGIPPAGHRLPAATRPGPVRLQVADLRRSLEYYGRVLGLRAVDRDRGRAALAAHGDDRPLVHLEEREGAAPVPRQGHIGLYHFALLLPTRADLGRFLRHLTEVAEPAGASDHLVSEALYLRDPDGLGIEVYADRPRSSWETRGRGIRMTTAPMDTRDVLAAAGDATWSGMPNVWAADAGVAGEDDAKLLEWSVELPDAKEVLAVAESLEAAGYPVERRSEAEIGARDPWGTRLRVSVAPASDGGA